MIFHVFLFRQSSSALWTQGGGPFVLDGCSQNVNDAIIYSIYGYIFVIMLNLVGTCFFSAPIGIPYELYVVGSFEHFKGRLYFGFCFCFWWNFQN